MGYFEEGVKNVAKHAAQHAAHHFLQQAAGGCMVTLIAMLSGVGTLFTLIGLVFFA